MVLGEFQDRVEKLIMAIPFYHTNISKESARLASEVIDSTFSIDGVLGAFAFTLSVPLIIFGNGLGAVIVRQLTISNISRIKRYPFLKNGAMYSILVLGSIMMADAFGMHIPQWLSPLVTFATIGYFFWKSKQHPIEEQPIPA